MPALEGFEGWYYWTFVDVDESTGISYILTSPGTGTKSDDLHTYTDECRDEHYNITEDPQSTGVTTIASDDTRVSAINGGLSISAASVTPIAVYNIHGQLIKRANARQLDCSLSNGVYVVRIGSTYRKVIVR